MLRAHQPSRLEMMLGRIDRRLVYLGLFLVTLIPMVAGFKLPLYPTEPPRMLAQTIDSLPLDKVVFISSDWDAGTQAESRPQMVGIVRHLIRRNLRFVIFSIAYPTSPQLGHTAVLDAIRLENAEDRYVYGTMWANLGYKLADDPWLRAFTTDIQQATRQDWKGAPLSQLTVMQGVHKFGPTGQVSMLINVTGSSTIEYWYQFLGPTKAKFGLGCTAVQAPEQYPYLDSGQLSGLLTGMKGAAEYELIIGAPGFGSAAMSGQSFAHLYILILIVLGNLSLLVGWVQRRQRGREAR